MLLRVFLCLCSLFVLLFGVLCFVCVCWFVLRVCVFVLVGVCVVVGVCVLRFCFVSRLALCVCVLRFVFVSVFWLVLFVEFGVVCVCCCFVMLCAFCCVLHWVVVFGSCCCDCL